MRPLIRSAVRDCTVEGDIERDYPRTYEVFQEAPPAGRIQMHPPPSSDAKLVNMQLQTLQDLYTQELKDLYSAEKQIVKALPKMVKAASNAQLKAGFQQHLVQTKEHAARLERLLSAHGESTRGPKCKGMEGVLKEGDEMIEEEANDEVRDAGLIAAGQRVEHYEIAGYGCARTYAEVLGDKRGAKVLQQTLDEEAATDKKLTTLAKSTINVAALK
ncbi:MAG: ferritin-like domain-containing protein [Chthoniobacteraceae bacterium]|jgi:ferritin-like metal-binding protein YciE